MNKAIKKWGENNETYKICAATTTTENNNNEK